MNIKVFGKGLGLFLTMLIILTVNQDDGVLVRMGLVQSLGVAILLSAIFASVLVTQNAPLIAAVLGLCFIANMPPGFALNFGLDRDLYIGLAVAVLSVPIATWVLE